MKKTGSILLFLLMACGVEPGTSPDPVRGPVGPSTFDIKDTWSVRSKTCEGADLPVKPHENYKLDADHLVRIELASESDTSLCKVGYAYDRIIASSQMEAGRYVENSLLKGNAAKKSCWKKEAGAVVGGPTDEVLQTVPELSNLKLTAVPASVTLELQQSNECPAGTLRLVIVKP